MTNVGSDDLLKRVASLKAGSARKPATVTESAALAFQRKPSYAGASSLLAAISAESGVRTHRPPILRGCHRVLQLCESTAGLSSYETAIQIREQSRLLVAPLQGARWGAHCT